MGKSRLGQVWAARQYVEQAMAAGREANGEEAERDRDNGSDKDREGTTNLRKRRPIQSSESSEDWNKEESAQ